MEKIYLVSNSPRRRELLRQIGIPFETLLLRSDPIRGMDVDETPIPAEDAEDYVRRVAMDKAQKGWEILPLRRVPVHPVLAADTAILLDGRIIGKPANSQNAVEILKALSGRKHEVLSATTLVFDKRVEVAVSRTSVTFCEIPEREIRDYVATGEPMDKAGAYAIQGRGAMFVEKIEGSYSGVMGLPLFETTQLLKKMNVS